MKIMLRVDGGEWREVICANNGVFSLDILKCEKPKERVVSPTKCLAADYVIRSIFSQ